MFCPRCGREGPGICAKCYLEGNPILLKGSEIQFCECGGWLYKGIWSKKPLDAINYLIKKNLVIPSELNVQKIEVLSYKHEDKKIGVDVEISGKYKNEDFSEKVRFMIKALKVTCLRCSRIAGNYFEAVLQLRGVSNIDINSSFVSSVKNVTGGTDIYLISADYAKKIGDNLRREGYIVTTSVKLVGMKDGVDIYRTYISIKPAPFNVGDFIDYKGRALMITKLGIITNYCDMDRKKNGAMPLSRLRNCQILARKEDTRKAIVSSVSPREAQIMDLETYEIFEVKSRGLKHGQEVEFVNIKGKIYIL